MTQNWKPTHKYDDILHLPHPVSTKHPHMSMHDRAAQFSPFAALTGHGAAIRETARLTSQKIELDEMEKELLDRKLQWLQANIELAPEVTVTYFKKDDRKTGGSYETLKERLRQIDSYKKCMVFEGKIRIFIEDIVEIDYNLNEKNPNHNDN